MTEYVLMPYEDYKNACDIIRSKTGTKELVKSGEFVKKLNSIQNVDVSGVTATANDVLNGKIIVTSNGSPAEGDIPNIGSQTGNISAKAGTVTISKGYHNGTGKIGISSTEQAKIIPGNIVENISILGVTGAVSPWLKISGTVSVSGSSSVTATISNSLIKSTSKISVFVLYSSSSKCVAYAIKHSTSTSVKAWEPQTTYYVNPTATTSISNGSLKITISSSSFTTGTYNYILYMII